MKDKLKIYRATIVKVIDGIETKYGIEGERYSEGIRTDEGKFRDFVTNEEYSIIEDINSSFETIENIEKGKQLALIYEKRSK